ncbi:hypothetical protein QVD17_26937 [Tagetes erecta]|uniref:Protein kinase domain-containing protein n=1 Tax=Tagetes erecta TaxID=13708 RepID=A0AAD8K9Z3_TARER|nr:hypothetical protein QVD17_26937 [Tagetes erecta]
MDAFMQTFLQPFQHLKIQLEEITSATNKFDEKNYIGGGGFGKVYKGVVSHSEGRSMVAIKRLDPTHGQGAPEFLKEITMLSRYRHQNLTSLLGFCFQGNEMILVYEHASRGSLDRHLKSPHLTWSQRIKICRDAAKGLNYLHDPRDTHQRLIHCDVKSANILLDDQWNAKVSDFGLAIMGPANEQQSVIVTMAVGTPGYCDPQYAMTHTLTKESDVYSFGVVLFEVLCGVLCCTYSKGRVQKKLVPTWTKSYEQNKINDIIFKNEAIQPLDQSALEIFSDIAYRCLKNSREERPKMDEVVKELESALESQELLESQEFSEWKEQLFYYEELSKRAEPPLHYRSKVELRKLLSKGVLVNGGRTWFSLNKKGEHCEMISFTECLDSVRSELEDDPWQFQFNSRFPVGTYHYMGETVKTRVKTQFLSPGITYTVNLVFKFRYPNKGRKCHYLISLGYKLQGETKTLMSYLGCEREDGWWTCELYQFTSDHSTIDLEIIFEGFYGTYHLMEVEGIEFRPLEKVEHKNEMLGMQPMLDANWEEKLPTNYEHMMKWSKKSLQWTTKKEAYSIICKGFLINDGQEWFCLDNNGKKCYMILATMACKRVLYEYYHALSLPESRFGVALECAAWSLNIVCKIRSQLLSPETAYASYLVYKLPQVKSLLEAPMLVKGEEYLGSDYNWYIYLVSPQTPVIRPEAGQKTHNPLDRPKIKGVPRERNDGWMEVLIWEFQTPCITTKTIDMHLQLTSCGNKNFSRLIIQGVEFRPI